MNGFSRVGVAFGLMASVALFAFGAAAQDVAPTSSTAAQPIPFGEYSQLTALGALIAVLAFIVMKMLPGLLAQIVATSEKQSRIFADTVTKIIEEWNAKDARRDAEITSALNSMREHCAARRAERAE